MLKAAVDEQVRRAEKEIKLKQKYAKKNNPIIEKRATNQGGYFNSMSGGTANSDKPNNMGLFNSSAYPSYEAYGQTPSRPLGLNSDRSRTNSASSKSRGIYSFKNDQ